ncbi:unnamed protein product [Prunus armeniaca]|uniref:UBC core domain-containing protein n=1 Tax=Prunus armeniaca TaxID=36596 RepID=A0A6J5VCF8_PRUAR|nr:unnamed protein product [Prunus armeniaca]
MREIQYKPSDDFKCLQLPWNPYEWQFGIRGARGTEFEGGIYHGRLLFPEEYPWKAPSFMFLTENGRFKTQTKIRLNWQSSWRVRDALLALVDEMDTYPDGELGSIKYSKGKRRALAMKSREAAPKYGTSERQKLIDEIHQNLLREAPVPVPQLQQTRNTSLARRCQEEVVVDRVGSTQTELDRSVIAEEKCNMENSGEKRVLEEYNEIESNPSYDFECRILNWNSYEWQFAIKGPRGTEFEGGIYHGMIQFPEGHPSKPPSFMFLTENGRFKIRTNLSLRLLSNWQSSWSVQNALLALIEEMPTYPDGELCSVKYNTEERRDLAIKSREASPKYGTSKRQKIIDEIHEDLLSKAPPVHVPAPQLRPVPSQASNGTGGGSVVGNIFYVINSNRVGVSMNDAPNPMITKLFWGFVFLVNAFGFFMFFVNTFCRWSYQEVTKSVPLE